MLVQSIEQQAWWRQDKAQAYPEDKRNLRASLALGELAQEVRSWPSDHWLLLLLGRWHPDLGTEVLMLGEQSNAALTRFRFDDPEETHEDFLLRFAKAFLYDRSEQLREEREELEHSA
jgi:hypothetical protein